MDTTPNGCSQSASFAPTSPSIARSVIPCVISKYPALPNAPLQVPQALHPQSQRTAGEAQPPATSVGLRKQSLAQPASR